MSVASAIWEKSTNIQCLTLDIYSVWPEVLIKIKIFIKYCLQVAHSFHYLEAALLGQKFFKVLFCTLCYKQSKLADKQVKRPQGKKKVVKQKVQLAAKLSPAVLLDLYRCLPFSAVQAGVKEQ